MTRTAIKRIVDYAVGRGTLAGAPGINHEIAGRPRLHA